jgi:hypothetical protein
MSGPRRDVRQLLVRTFWSVVGLVFLDLMIVTYLATNHATTVARGELFVIILVLMAVVVTPILLVRRIEDRPVPAAMLTDPWIDNAFPESDDAVRTAVARWNVRLEVRNDDLIRRRVLADLVEDRLRLVHGVDVLGDPERVRRLVGPRLWSVLNAPPQTLSPEQLAHLITEMEAL